MDATSLSMIEQCRDTFLRDAVFRPDDSGPAMPGVRHRERMRTITGSGYMEQVLFANGLMAGRGGYQLTREYRATYHDMETYFGFGFLIDGRFTLELPERRQREQIAADELWLRSGRAATLQYLQPAGQRLEGISIDATAGLLETWKHEAPKSINPGVRAALAASGPLLRRLPGQPGRLRDLALRMLGLDTGSLCGRLQLESLALDLLVGVLQAEAGGPLGLTRAERRDARLRVALDDARDILDAEWSSPPTIAELARRAGLNECYLKAGFRERFGRTIGAYVRMRRMEHARRLIEREGYGAQQAAFAVGFSNPGWFSATFKQYFGCLPSCLGESTMEADGP